MNLNNWAEKCHEISRSKGWYDTERHTDEFSQLFVTEVAEGSDEARKPNLPPIYQFLLDGSSVIDHLDASWDPTKKPEGEAIEMVDILIRLGDYFGYRKFNLGYELSRLVGCSQDPELNEVIELLDEKEFAGAKPLTCHFQIVREIVRANKMGDGFHYAQIVVTILNYMKHRGWNIQDALEIKQAYNEKRPYRHGGKLA